MKKLFSIFVAIMAITINVSAQSWTPVITDVNGSRTNNRVVYQKGYTRNNGIKHAQTVPTGITFLQREIQIRLQDQLDQ